MTTTLKVKSSQGTYEVVIGENVYTGVGEYLSSIGVDKGSRLFLLTDENVQASGFSAQVTGSCRAAGYEVHQAVIPPGDASKSLQTAESLYLQMAKAQIRRNGVLLAVGGGVVGDLGGFVAATYQRGIRFVQLPTTLLAHDSSIGGKVGVNLPTAKNLVGAFHQPLAVLYDVAALSTLPEREWSGGMAEVIKHGIIGDKGLFEELEQHPVRSYPGATQTQSLLARAVAVKIGIVERDERETELRMLLNLGHTVGHAVEQLSHYTIHHGEAVSIGIRVESEVANQRGWLSDELRDRINSTLRAHGLPIDPPSMPFPDVLNTLNLDKKHGSHGWTFVLPKGLEDVVIVRDVTEDELWSAWSATVKE